MLEPERSRPESDKNADTKTSNLYANSGFNRCLEKNRMSEDLREAALTVCAAIFEGRDSVEVEGVTYLIEKTSKSKLRSVEIDGLTFIEQNPYKESRWAQLAKDGHQIMWVMRGRQYIARVMDGKFLGLGNR